MGLIALGLAIIGFALACSRAVFLVGFLYPIIGFAFLASALVLGVVAICRRNRAKWPGVAAIVASAGGAMIALALIFVANVLSSSIGYR